MLRLLSNKLWYEQSYRHIWKKKAIIKEWDKYADDFEQVYKYIEKMNEEINKSISCISSSTNEKGQQQIYT